MDPMFAFLLEFTFLTSILLIVGAGVLVIGAFLMLFTIRKVPPGKVGVRVGLSFGWQWPPMKAKYVMSDTLIIRIPLITRYELMDISVQRLQIKREGKDGLICKDNIRADIDVAFYIKVNYPAMHLPEHIDSDSEEAREIFALAENLPDKEKYAEVKRVAQTVTCERASHHDKLSELFEAKFSEALKTAGKEMDFKDLYTDRQGFRKAIIRVIGYDLEGYRLTDVAIDYLEQTPVESLDPNNVLDAEGIKKITLITATEQEFINERERAREIKINEQDRQAEVQVRIETVDADVAKRAQDVRDAEDEAKQSRAVSEARATEEAEARKVVEIGRQTQEEATIGAQESIDVRSVEKERTVLSANFSKDQDLRRLEQETLEAGEQATVDRERRIGLSEQEKEAVVIAKKEGVEESKAGLAAKAKSTVDQEQGVMDEQADREADRAYRVSMVQAKTAAETAQVEQVVAAKAKREAEQEQAELEKFQRVVAADADKEAADRDAERVQVLAAAEANASEKRNHAMQQEAQGQAALKSADGLAEARVTEAKGLAKKVDAEGDKAQGLATAAVTEAQGVASGKAKSAEGTGEATAISEMGKAEGEAISAKGTAEGTSIDAIKGAEASGREKMGLAEAIAKTEMAKAIELFNAASKDHEEFRLQLSKDRDVDLAEINIQKDIAEAQATVLGEALKSANIDLVGGEQDFFDRVVASVSRGKVVDRLVNSSQVVSDVKNTFFNGDPDYFKNQLTGWIKATGLSSEDVKNLTVSALLASLISKTDDNALRGLMRGAEKALKGTTLGSSLADLLLGEKAAE
jgi:uncharacterized membrane protein YqiK